MGIERPARELVIRGPLERSDLPGLYRRVCAALEGCRGGLLICDLGGVYAEAVAIEALARLALRARQHRCQVELRGCTEELDALIELVGLQETLKCRSATAGRTAETGSGC